MSKEVELIEKIDDYLSGTLSAEDSLRFESELTLSNELKKAVTNQKTVNSIVIGSRLSAVKNIMTDDFFEANQTSNFLSTYKWWLVIAAIATGSIVYYYARNNGGNATIKNSVQPIEIIAAGGKNQIQQLENKGQEVLVKKNGKVVLPIENKKDSVISGMNEVKTAIQIVEPIIAKENSQKQLTPIEVSPTKIIPKVEKAITNNEPVEKTEVKIERPKTISFKPEFGESAQIPLIEGATGKIVIFNRAGLEIWNDALIGENLYIWDGKNKQGGVSSPGLYLYNLEYSSENKVSGQIIIY